MLVDMTMHFQNRHDLNDNPAGGFVVLVTDEETVADHLEFADFDATRRTAPAIYIRWQDGPLGSGDTRRPMNGAGVEDVLNAALQRLEWYQQPDGPVLEGKFACVENAEAIEHLQAALNALRVRTARRANQGVEGTYEGS